MIDENIEEDASKKLRFKTARNGDHMICPFQCDMCHFHNIQKSDPSKRNYQDELLGKTIRRAILDSLWARESSTVTSNRIEGTRYISACRMMGVQDQYPTRGPYDLEDAWGCLLHAWSCLDL